MARKRKDKPQAEPTSQAETPQPLTPSYQTRFKHDWKRQEKRGKDMAKLEALMSALAERRTLDPRRRDHALAGDWVGRRECHVEPDWLLVYEITESEISFWATGTHSDLFG